MEVVAVEAEEAVALEELVVAALPARGGHSNSHHGNPTP